MKNAYVSACEAITFHASAKINLSTLSEVINTINTKYWKLGRSI